MYLAAAPRRGLGRRGRRLGQIETTVFPNVLSWFAPTPSVGIDTGAPTAIRPAACSWYDYIWPTKACTDALALQQINSVAINAATAGYSPSVVTVAQQVAAQQDAQSALDQANIYDYYATNPPGAPSTPTWVWVALVVGGGLVVVKLLS